MQIIFTGSLGVIFFIIVLSIYFFFGFCMMKIFRASGVQPTWAGWVPIYGQFKFLEAGGQNGWLILWNLVPIFGSLIFLIYTLIAAYHISEDLGRNGVLVLLYIFLPWLWLILMAAYASKMASQNTQQIRDHTAALVQQVQQEMLANSQTPPTIDGAPVAVDNLVANAAPHKFQPYENLQQRMNAADQPPEIILNKQSSLGEQPTAGSNSVNEFQDKND